MKIPYFVSSSLMIASFLLIVDPSLFRSLTEPSNLHVKIYENHVYKFPDFARREINTFTNTAASMVDSAQNLPVLERLNVSFLSM